MKILYNLEGTFNSGGMERIVISKVNALAQRGHELIIVTTEQKHRKPFFEIDHSVKTIDLDINYSDNNGKLISKIAHFPHKQKLHFSKLQKVVDLISPDIIVSTFGNESRIIPKINTSAKRILEIHFSKYFRYQECRKGLWRIIDTIRSKQDERLIRLYDKFVVLTYEDKQYWGSLPNITVIPNFVDKISDNQAHLDNKVCVAVGRLTFQKGYDHLLKIWKNIQKACPDWRLEIYGNGEMHDILQESISSLNIANSVKLNPATQDIFQIYQNSSILLLTSRYEGLPMVLIEAISNGLPVVAFACKCGPRDIISDGENGYLVEEGDYDKFAERVIALISDIELRKEIGNKAYSSAKNYTKESIMPQWESLFRSLSKNE